MAFLSLHSVEVTVIGSLSSKLKDTDLISRNWKSRMNSFSKEPINGTKSSLLHLLAHLELRRIFELSVIERLKDITLYRLNGEIRAVFQMHGDERHGEMVVYFTGSFYPCKWLRGRFEGGQLVGPLVEYSTSGKVKGHLDEEVYRGVF